METKEARYGNLVLGGWLFVSAFLWHHGAAQFANTWVFGLVSVVVAAISLIAPPLRFVNTGVGIWLVISTFAFPHVSAGTVWNNVLVGAAILFVSLMGAWPRAAGRRWLQPSAR
jgi:hypothetical protein